MKRWKNWGWLGALTGACLVVAGLIQFSGKSQAVANLDRSASAQPGKLIVHEWGTFTSFSGSNGAQLDFRPLLNEDLPSFVLDRESQFGVPVFTKSRIRAKIRMETPVTYFYTDVERTIQANVGFPKGLLTEFYPPVDKLTPAHKAKLTTSGHEIFGNSTLDWGDVHLIPAAKLTSQVQDPHTREWLRDLAERKILPHDNNPSDHYYHARETDSALVHVHREPKGTQPAGDFIEKFLFYRGVGRFDQPLDVVVTEDNRFKVTNKGQQEIRSLFRVTCANRVLTYSLMDSLAGGTTAEFPTEEKSVTSKELQEQVAKALVAEKLYPKEAAAMVKTWADSWFAEEGTRVFYMVPRDVTDQVLPLTISPAPDETVRVLVGRVEVLSPTTERELMKVIGERAVTRAEHAAAGDNTPLPIPAELTKLGRLAEPALVRVRELAKDDRISREAELLQRECQKAINEQAAAAN